MTPEQQIKQLRTTPLKPGAQDIEAMTNRQLALDLLYHLAGRNLPGNTMKGLYTGLYAPVPDNI